ncbi:MAG TPA: hypothetical protein ENN81_13640 [Phycisphaerales bacterium]|nr:hypothetical protein [Phycisphaerales bacterium]
MSGTPIERQPAVAKKGSKASTTPPKARGRTAKEASTSKKTGKTLTVKATKARKPAARKAATVKPAVQKAVRTPKPHLTEAELLKFRNLLLAKRREIVGSFEEIENEALRQSRLDAAGDLSSMPIHMADLGSDNFEQEFALGLMDNERQLLQEIDMALARIAEGTYGYCDGTGKPIPKARLAAKPWARYCVEYARLVEEGKIPQFEQ